MLIKTIENVFQGSVLTERVIAAALAHLGVVEEGGDNKGQMVEIMLRHVGLEPGSAWCAAYVSRVGYYALLNPATRASSWPLPATGSCWWLGDFAKRHGLLVTEPKVGDVFLIYNNNAGYKRFSHTGFIVGVDQNGMCLCIEGNTTADGSHNGNAVLIRPRIFRVPGGDRFVRWTRMVEENT